MLDWVFSSLIYEKYQYILIDSIINIHSCETTKAWYYTNGIG